MKREFEELYAKMIRSNEILPEEWRELQELQEEDESAGEMIPGVEDTIYRGDTAYLLRNYIEGVSLAELGEMHGFAEEIGRAHV